MTKEVKPTSEHDPKDAPSTHHFRDTQHSTLHLATHLAAVCSVPEIGRILARRLDGIIRYDTARLIAAEGDTGPAWAITWHPGGAVDIGTDDDLFENEPGPGVTRATDVEGRQTITLALVHQDRVVGTLGLAREAERPFDADDAAALELLAGPIVSALVMTWRFEESERRRRELTEIIETSRSFAAYTEARDLCGAIAERAAHLVSAESCFVATWSARRSALIPQAPGFNVHAEELHELRFATDAAEPGVEQLRWLEPFYSNAPADDPRFASLLSETFRPESILCAPMRAKGETVGFIFAANRAEGFDHKSARMLGAVAPQAAAALSNAQMIEAAKASARREVLLNRITTSVRESLELDEVLEAAVRTLGPTLDLCRCYVAFVDKTRRVATVAYEYHIPDVCSTIGEFPLAGYGSTLLATMERGDIFSVDETSTDARVAPFRERYLDPLGVRSLMYIPVLQDRTLAAVLGFSQCRYTRRWTEEEIAFAQAVANQLAVAIRQARLYDRERRAAQYRELLNRINRVVRASLDVDTILETTVEALGTALHVDRCFVLAPGPFPPTVETATVRFEYCKPGVASVRGLKIPVRNRAREGPVGMIEEPLAIADIIENPRLVSRRKADLLNLTETRAMLSVRAVYGEQVLAILELDQCYEPRAWSREEIDLIGEVGAHLAVGVHNALLFRRVTNSEHQWNTTFNSMTDGVALLDPNGLVLRLNDSMLRFCNLEQPQDAIGRHCYELLYGETEPLRDSPVERVLSTGQRMQIERDIAARGESLRESIDPIFDDTQQIAGLVLIVRDVTREREAERAIRYRNRQLAALNAIASATLHARDLQMIWEGAFARIIDVTGADAGAILTLDDEAERLDPVATHGGAARAASLVDRDSTAVSTAAVLAADVPLALEELPVPFDPNSDDGFGYAFASALYAPIRSQRRPVGLLVIAYASKRLFSANERQLLTVAGQQIGAAVENARLITNLQQALERVREANRLKDEFLATVSHELRTPLTAIQGWAEVLGDPETSPEETREGLSTIQQASESLTQLISDLLEMSRIETRMLRLERQPIDPNYPVQAAVQTVRHMAEAKGVAIETDLDRDLPSVDADSGRLQQVMWNLLVNAIKFTPAGGHVWITTDLPEPDRIRVRVRDDGAGIEPDFLPHVFERFRQADGSATRQYGGLGIGLSLVRSLIDAHDGTVEVDSEGIGHGATFTILLPAVGPQ